MYVLLENKSKLGIHLNCTKYEIICLICIRMCLTVIKAFIQVRTEGAAWFNSRQVDSD